MDYALHELASQVSFSHYFVFDRMLCVLATFEERRHFVMLIIIITYSAKLLNADWLRQRAFFLNHDLEGTFGNQERA